MQQSDVTIDELLQHQDKIYLIWSDPWPGQDPNGKLVDACIISRATVRDCINIARYVQTPNGVKGMDFSNQDLLRGFIEVNHARLVTVEETGMEEKL